MAGKTAKVALFWDESYIWGLIACRTFRNLRIDFDLLTSSDICEGKLDGYDLLFVPGGWASDKIVALGLEGAESIRRFVEGGGGYLGVCGGAGLALSHESGLGLTPFGRMPTGTRLPSFSGRIVLEQSAKAHPMWRGIAAGSAFYAWWPGQFNPGDTAGINILARYGEPQPGSFVTDLPVLPDFDWARWEAVYGINLDPARIKDEPAVLELGYGAGRVLLSYLHFETPWDQSGCVVLKNLVEYLSGKPACEAVPVCEPEEAAVEELAADNQAAALTTELMKQSRSFIHFGKENFLWYWRSDWLLNWRRGIRGIEYSTVHAMLGELDRLVRLYGLDEESMAELNRLGELIREFFHDARQLLILERYALSQGTLSPLKSDDENISALRGKLFSQDKRWGGLFEKTIKQIDAIFLLPLLRREMD